MNGRSDETAARPRVLFIGGIGRSGTTVLERSLGTDPRVVSLGEVTHLWQRSLLDGELCGCGLAFRECEFWRRVGDQGFGGWDRVDAARLVDLKDRLDRSRHTPRYATGAGAAKWRDDLQEYADHYRRVYSAALEVSGAQVAIDSSKQASLPHILLGQGIDLSVLHCVRDSRAVAYSWMQKVTRPEGRAGEERQYMKQYSPATIAGKWNLHNAVVDALALRGHRPLRLRYEDWVDDPVGSVARVLAFAGLAVEGDSGRIGATWVDLAPAHTCSGNPMRFTVGRVDIRRDQRWEQGLSRRDRTLVTALTWPFLLRYGYRP